MVKVYYSSIDWYTEKDYMFMTKIVDSERSRRAEKYIQKEDYKRCI